MANKISVNDLKSKKNNFVMLDVRESDESENGVVEDLLYILLD